jgi:hypothetical protein
MSRASNEKSREKGAGGTVNTPRLAAARCRERIRAGGTAWLQMAVIMLTLLSLGSFAADLVTSSVDGGGGRSSADLYVNDARIGVIGGLAGSGGTTNRSGFLGQLTEAISLAVTGTPALANETTATQLSGAAAMDDDSVTELTGADIRWSLPIWPLHSIGASGLALTTNVYQNTTALFSGAYLGIPGSGSLLVLDSMPDNFGAYAGDGLPDVWQIQYFAFDNPNAAPHLDPDWDNQSNLFEYQAKTDPTNGVSRFRMWVEYLAGATNPVQIVFSPRWPDRTYSPFCTTNLVNWIPFTNYAPSDVGLERRLVDLDVPQPRKFYRIQIAPP